MLLAPSVGCVSLITESTRPYTSQVLLKGIRQLDEYIHRDTLQLEKFGISRDLTVLTVPSILVDLAGEGSAAMEELARLSKAVMYGGAPLPLKVGDELAEHGVNLYSAFGM